MRSAVRTFRHIIRGSALVGLCCLFLTVDFSVMGASADSGGRRITASRNTADSESAERGSRRSRVYNLRHITSQKAQEMLSQLKIGEEYNPLKDDILIVTSTSGNDLNRASEVIPLLDQAAPVEIRVLMAKTEQTRLPDVEAFNASMRSVSAGTMTDAPPKGSENPAIVDILDDKLVAIAATGVMEEIQKAFDAWKEKNIKEPQAPSEPAEESAAVSLTEAAAALFGDDRKAAPEITEPNIPVPVTEAAVEELETEESFMEAELLKALDAAEKKAETQAAAVPDETVKPIPRPKETEQPVEEAPKDDLDALQKVLEALNQGQPPVQTGPGREAEAAKLSDKIVQPQETEPMEPEEARTEFEKAVGDELLDLILDLPQEVELESLVDLVGKQLGLNYMYDQNLLRNQKVFLKIHGGKIKVRDVYALLEIALQDKGFIMVRQQGNLVRIMKAADAAKLDPVIRSPDEPIQPGDIIVSSLFNLENISTSSAKTMLTQMNLGLPNGFQEVPETGTLIVTDYAYRMERIRNVLSMVDVPGEPKEYRYRKLVYLTPGELVPKLTELAGKLEGVSVQVAGEKAPAAPTRMITQRVRDPQTGRYTTKQVPAPGSTPAAAAGGAGDSKSDTVQIEMDERTNRILMIGTLTQIETVNELVDTLDVPKYDLKYVKEYVIQYVEASEVVDVLNELGLVSVTVSTASGGGTSAAAARQTAAQRRATPQTPAAPAAAAAPSSARAASADEPSISIRMATNSLLVNATEEQHRAVELAIAYVDVVQKDQRTIREYEIQNVDTQEIIDTMMDLGIVSQSSVTGGTASQGTAARSATARSTVARTTAPQAGANPDEAAPTASALLGVAGGEKELTTDEPQISVLEATNSMLVYATPRQHDAIALVIAHADRVPEVASTPYVVYALENQDPLELAEVLSKLIQETVEETAAKTSAGASAADSKIQARTSAMGSGIPTLEEEKIRIIPDEMSYSLIVYANKRNQQWISDLIKELDQYRPQVLLDVTLVEITKQDDFNYALNVLHSIPDLTNTSGLTGTISGSGESIITKDDILTKLLAATDRNQFIDMQSNGGSFTGFYGNEKVMALLTAMQTKGYGRIMANPKLLVDDNQEGTIETKQTTYITRTTTSYQNTTSGDPIQTTNTEFDPYDASINMMIKPHISKGNNLRLEITLSRSDFLGFDSTSEKPPNQANTDVDTVVTVPDNSTIILGGMDKVVQSKGGDKVPILGDLPLIGGLFRSTSNANSTSKLYVFIMAHILRPGTDMTSLDLKNISNKYRLEFEENEAEMQEYEDWPGIKPTPMAPEKVLKDNFKIDEE